jgi:hypothetical protein
MDAERDLFGQRAHCATMAVIQYEDFLHGGVKSIE